MISKVFTTEHDQNWFSYQYKSSEARMYYHYTSLDGALSILNGIEKDKDSTKYQITLFATHLFYLNDRHEFQAGMDKVIDKLREILSDDDNDAINQYYEFIIESLSDQSSSIASKYIKMMTDNKAENFNLVYPNLFEISFCAKNNLLSQWKYYGKDSGIAIEFDLGNCLYRGNVTNKSAGNLWAENSPRFISYSNLDQVQTIEQIFSDRPLNTYDAQGRLIAAIIEASFMKNDAFKEEEEYRLLFPLVYNPSACVESDALQKISYRHASGIIKPYIKIKIRHKTDQLPIKSLIVGPGENQEIIYNALVNLIESKFPTENIKTSYKYIRENGLEGVLVNGIKVYKSLIPFRGI